MPSTRHEGRVVLIDKIDRELGAFQKSVAIAIKNNLPSYNVVAETVLAGLLNHIHGWKLVNANAITRNSAGVDLIDSANRISVQVTSTNTLQKLDHTLEQFEGKKLDADYDRLIHLIITTDTPTAAMKQRTRSTWFSGSNDLWNIPELLAQIQTVDISKLEIIADYLNREVAAFGQYVTESHLYLPPLTALGDDFVGREAELQSIHSQIFSKKPVYLSGLGGMGKTELAVRFAREYSGGTVYFAHFSESFTKTITAMFSGVYPRLPADQPQPSDTEQYNTVISLLEKCGEKDILIIDNMDANQREWNELMRDPAYKKLCSMKLRLLITTRFEHDRAIPINRMEDETLFEIFKKHGADLTEAEMKELIDEVNGHTMTIDLIARTLNGKGLRKVTAEMMLTALRNNTLPNEKYRKIATDYNQSPEQAQIYQHLSTVFNVSEISDGDKELLRCATLFPENGISGDLMAGIMSEDGITQLESLMERGWLEMKDDLLIIHPVIRLVCRTELMPTDENCGDFLDALWEQFSSRDYDQLKYSQLAEVYFHAIQFLKPLNIKWLNHCTYLFNTLTRFETVATIYQQFLPFIESQDIPPTPLATTYNNAGVAYSYIGELKKSLDFHAKALNLRVQSSDTTEHELPISYNNLGAAYGDIGEFDIALKHLFKAVEIHRERESTKSANCARCYINIATVYLDLHEHSTALQYGLDAVAILIQILQHENHPDLATACHIVGVTYAEMGDFPNAEAYIEKALAIMVALGHSDVELMEQSLMNIRIFAMLHKAGVSLDDFAKADDDKREKFLQEIATPVCALVRNDMWGIVRSQ